MRYTLVIFLIILHYPLYSQNLSGLKQRADNLYLAGEYGMATTLYDSLLRFQPGNIEYIKRSASSYLHSGKIETAKNRFLNALMITPSDPEITFSLGDAYDRLGMGDSAIYYFQQFINLKPEDPYAYNRLAVIYMELQGYEDSAVQVSSRGVGKNPHNPDSWYMLAMSYINASRPVDAIVSAKEGLEKDSLHSILYIPLGLGYLLRNDYEQASTCFEKGMEMSEEKSIFIEYAVKAKLLDNTDPEIMSEFQPENLKFREFNSDNLNNLLAETKDKNSPYYYPGLVKRFNNDPVSFGLDEFLMLYLGFTGDKSYSPYYNENEELEDLREQKNYTSYFEEGRKYLIRNPADFPLYLNMAGIAEYLGLHDRQYLNLFCYYGFLNAIFATGNGKTQKQAYIVTYISHEYSIISEMGFSLISQSLLENKNQYYDMLKVVDQEEKENNFYFNITIPYRWMEDVRGKSSGMD